MDARQGFPELIGLEKIAAEIRQGQRQSLELKEISREQPSKQPLYFDLYFTCDPGEFPSENTLMILIIETAESLAENEFNLFQTPQAVAQQLDPLTNLANRQAFEDYLYEEWRHLQRQQRSLALILCDLDYFKRYNETYGYAVGDQCLQEVAKILKSVTRRPADLIARFQGQQFGLILPDTENDGAFSLAELLRQKLIASKLPHQGSPREQILTLSCGIASRIPTVDLNPKCLINHADQALHQAKQQGRDRAVLFSP